MRDNSSVGRPDPTRADLPLDWDAAKRRLADSRASSNWGSVADPCRTDWAGASPSGLGFDHAESVVWAEGYARGMRRWLAVAFGLVALCVTGCGGSTKPSRSVTCSPSFPQVSRHQVQIGGSVVLYNPGLRCRPKYAAGQTYRITLRAPVSGRMVTMPSVRVGVDGAFRVTVRIPEFVRPGRAYLLVSGPLLDRRWCPVGDCAADAAVLHLTAPRNTQ